MTIAGSGWDTGDVTAELASVVAKHRHANISFTQTTGTPKASDHKTDDVYLFHEFDVENV
jgi:hypothetical protein